MSSVLLMRMNMPEEYRYSIYLTYSQYYYKDTREMILQLSQLQYLRAEGVEGFLTF